MTEKLYDANAYLKTFTAQVLSCEPVKDGYAVILNRTAFYPEGGGQSCDLGVLGGLRVTDVQERGGEVIHTVPGPLAGEVEGVIDFDRRFDLMQQHSGEHLVSGLVHSRFGYENVGFHMGKELITIDFDGVLTWEQLQDIELAANRAIWANLETQITVYPSADACQSFYRSKKEIEGPLRVVSFPGVDACACCGTHVARTGEIGLVKLLSVVKFHQGVRVELACGARAFGLFASIWQQNREISALLSAKPLQTAPAVERVLGELEQTKTRAASWESLALARQAEHWAGLPEILYITGDLGPDSLRRLAIAAMEQTGGRLALFSGSDEAGYAYVLAQQGGDLRALTRALNEGLRGRGGGKPGFSQGRVAATAEEIRAFFAALV